MASKNPYIHVYITQEQLEKLEAKKKESGVNISEMIRRAIDAYLAYDLKKKRS